MPARTVRQTGVAAIFIHPAFLLNNKELLPLQNNFPKS